MESEAQSIEEAQVALQKAVIDYEKAIHGTVNYRDWSFAKGCAFAERFEASLLPEAKLKNCRIVSNRYELIKTLSPNGLGVEVGTQYGDFARKLIELASPQFLHLIDHSFEAFDRSGLDEWIADGRIKLHEGDSAEVLSGFSDDSLDWVYLDADHSYDGVTRDLKALESKLKPEGILICNDYTQWSPLEALPYGVPRAVHEFCQDYNWEFHILALHRWGYHDLALKRS